MSSARQEVVDTLLPHLQIRDDALKEDGSLDPASLFPTPYSKLIFEIGFGYGERLAEMMRRHPENAYIGAEPFLNGMAAFLSELDEAPSNLRVSMDDALRVARSLKDSCVDELYILNPDPWHKTRHHKRRIVSIEKLDVYARILKPGGTLYLSSDVPDMIDWMAAHTVMHPAFEWTALRKSDWENPPRDWIHTRYETKGAKGAKKMCYLIYKRRP